MGFGGTAVVRSALLSLELMEDMDVSMSGMRCRCFRPFRITYVPLLTSLAAIVAEGGYGMMSSGRREVSNVILMGDLDVGYYLNQSIGTLPRPQCCK